MIVARGGARVLPFTSRLAAVRLFGAIGGGLCLLTAGVLLTGGVPGVVSPPNIPWLADMGFVLAYAVIGAVALAAAAQAGRDHVRAAGSFGMAGLFALTLDATDVPASPRAIPGVLLVAAACTALTLRGERTVGASFGLGRMLAWAAAGVGLVAQVLLGVFIITATGLVAPWWLMLILLAVWGLQFVLALWLLRMQPWLVLVIPPITFAVVFRLLLFVDELVTITASLLGA